jgi:hypothetical protein
MTREGLMTSHLGLRAAGCVAAVAAVLLASPATVPAHGPKIGVNGGIQADAGDYHLELVSNGNDLVIFLRDHGDKDVAAAGHKGIAIFVIDGKPQRIPLAPAGGNKLSGTAAMTLPKEPKGAVQITTPAGSTVQAKFQ